MPFPGRGAILGIALTILLLASFSHPATAHRGLVIQPTVSAGTPVQAAAGPAPAVGTSGPRRLVLRATGYNSLPGQTFGNPHITATGETTRLGIIAASRDLIGSDLPYGSLVRIVDRGSPGDGRGAGAFQELLDEHGPFIVEDTMHIRKTQQIDVWFPELSTALGWGVREVEIEIVRHGRDGLLLEQQPPRLLVELPAFAAPGPGS